MSSNSVVPDLFDLALEALLPCVELDDLDVVQDLVHRLGGWALTYDFHQLHPIWFITDTSNFRLVCPLEFPNMVHTTSLI